jgi:transposase InsO family protein
VVDGLLLRGNRLVIPPPLRVDILNKIHTGHLGIAKCRERACQAVWWPGLSAQLEQLVKNCRECCKNQKPSAEPLCPSTLPDLPFQKVATDLFEWNNKPYLLVVDYYSRFVEIAKLSGSTATEVITHTKSIFAQHGIQEVVVSDNSPQYSSAAYTQFVREYGFSHMMSSPLYPQGNGEAEKAVRTVKDLLWKQ